MNSFGRLAAEVLGAASLPRVFAGIFVTLSLVCFHCHADEVLYDGFQQLATMQREVRDVVEVDRKPLFDNAPFLHLREGDKLVKAKHAKERGKQTAFPDEVYCFLFSGGKYYQLWTTEEDGKLLLSDVFHSAHACLLFDWEPTLANAQELRKILPLSQSETIPVQRYKNAIHAIQDRFPELSYTFDTYAPVVKPGRLVTIPGQMAFEFEGISYDYSTLRFHHYKVRIGPHVCLIVGELLLQGPPSVERWEFEGSKDYDVPNGLMMPPPAPKVAKSKKAAYDRMQQFNDLVNQSIWPDRLKRK